MSEHFDSPQPRRVGRHRIDDEPGNFAGVDPVVDDVDDDFNSEESAGKGRNVPSGPPLRPLAIALLLIGLCLVGFGLYSYFGGNSDETSAQESGQPSSSAESNPAQSGAAQNPAQPGQAGQPGQPGQDGEGATPAPPAQPSGNPAEPGANNPAQPGAPAPGAAPVVDKAAVKVSVLNNSTTTGLADDTMNKLSEAGWGRGETGNASEQEAGVWEKTTVYYTPGNEGEKAAAEQIAAENGWEVAPRDPRLDGKPGGVVVVATDHAV